MPVFVDTNIFAYALDAADPTKQARAQHVIEAHGRDIVISTQVLLELHSVCTRKLAMPRQDAQSAIEAISDLIVVATDRDLVLRAVMLAGEAQLSIFDAAIVTAAQRSGCERLFTEDLNAGQRFGDVRVENPLTAEFRR